MRWSASKEAFGFGFVVLEFGLELPVAGCAECRPSGEVWRTRPDWLEGVWLGHQ